MHHLTTNQHYRVSCVPHQWVSSMLHQPQGTKKPRESGKVYDVHSSATLQTKRHTLVFCQMRCFSMNVSTSMTFNDQSRLENDRFYIILGPMFHHFFALAATSPLPQHNGTPETGLQCCKLQVGAKTGGSSRWTMGDRIK